MAQSFSTQRNAVALGLVLLCCSVYGLSAAPKTDPVLERQQLMKDVALATKDGSALARGTVEFDVAKAKEVMQVYIKAADRFPKLFPATSRNTKLKNSASPKIWSDMAGFKKASAKFGADAKQGLKAIDTTTFAEAFKTTSGDCASCHGAYRVKS